METHLKCEPSEELKKQLTEAGYTAGFCMAELLEQLPEQIQKDGELGGLEVQKLTSDYDVHYRVVGLIGKKMYPHFSSNSLPDALAMMYLYLKKEGL